MIKYITISRKEFERMFRTDDWKGWVNFGGFWTKADAIKQMEDYIGEGSWALVPPAKLTQYSGGYYQVLFKEKK